MVVECESAVCCGHMKKVVFVSTTLPFPVDEAKKVTLSGFLKYLCERYGTEHVSYVLVGPADNEEPSGNGMPRKLLTVKKPGILAQLWSMFWFVAVKRAKSIQESMLYSARLGRELRSTLANINPDLIVCDTLRTGQFFETAKRPDGYYILHMDDLFSVRYQRIAEDLKRFPAPTLDLLGNFTRFVPSFFRSFIRANFAQRWVLRLEQGLIGKREQDIVKWFDTTLLVSSEETSLLQSKTRCAH